VEHLVLGLEALEERALRDPSALRDLGRGGVDAALEEDLAGRAEQVFVGDGRLACHE
jgi:hypothetical protein